MKNLIKSFGSSSKGNSILVGEILLDAGVSPYKINPKPKAVLITHSHRDHMQYAKDWQKRGITCYSGEIETSAFGKKINVWDKFTIGDYHIQSLPSVHDTENALNFVIDINGKRILYEVDSAKRTYDIHGVTHFIAECNWDEATMTEAVSNGILETFQGKRLRATHKSLEILLEELTTMDTSKLEEIWLAHCSDRNLNRELAKVTIQEKVGVPVYFA